MAKGLLLGNGINAYLGINDLSIINIGRRFRKNVTVYAEIIQDLFDVRVDDIFLGFLEKSYGKSGIELLAGKLYKYIRDNKKGMWSDNDEYRVQDVITCICLSSIFFAEEGKINHCFDETKLFSMDQYDYIYTLNYVEFWDKKQQCIYLHGKIDLQNLPDKKRAVLISAARMHFERYIKAVNKLKKENNVIEFIPNDIIFAPESIEKNKLVCVSGVFPSEKLYPADDLFMYRAKELYKDLEKVNELSIFGMSPYGDESILEIINKRDKVKIYIYKKNESIETGVWKKKLTCKYELLDSEEIG